MWPHGSCTPNIDRNLSTQITLSPGNKLRIAARYDGHFGYSGVRWRALPTFFASVMSSRHTMHVLSPDCTKSAKWDRAKWDRYAAEWSADTWTKAATLHPKGERRGQCWQLLPSVRSTLLAAPTRITEDRHLHPQSVRSAPCIDRAPWLRPGLERRYVLSLAHANHAMRAAAVDRILALPCGTSHANTIGAARCNVHAARNVL